MESQEKKKLPEDIELKMEALKRLSREEFTRELGEATKFCLQRKLLFPDEIKKLQNREQGMKIGLSSWLRRELYLKAHPEESQK